MSVRNTLLGLGVLVGVFTGLTAFTPLWEGSGEQSSRSIADLSDGRHQLCQPAADGLGPCFIFEKHGSQVKGYYGYPYSESFLCLQGTVQGEEVKGKAQAPSWEANTWTRIPDGLFIWDAEGHLALNSGRFIRGSEGVDWVHFQWAVLTTKGFSLGSTLEFTDPHQLCPGESEGNVAWLSPRDQENTTVRFR